MLVAHGVNLGPLDYAAPLWPAIAAVLALLCVVAVFLAIIQTLRLRDRPTRWETQRTDAAGLAEIAEETRRMMDADVHYHPRGPE